jgi:hypothetical protein
LSWLFGWGIRNEQPIPHRNDETIEEIPLILKWLFGWKKKEQPVNCIVPIVPKKSVVTNNITQLVALYHTYDSILCSAYYWIFTFSKGWHAALLHGQRRASGWRRKDYRGRVK